MSNKNAKTDVEQSPFVVERNVKTNKVTKVVVGSDFQVGSNSLKSDIKTSGAVTAKTGLSGSLTKLSDGRSYIVAGSNTTITSASNGQITISATGGGGDGDIEGVTAGTGLSGGGTSGTVTLNLDFSELTDMTGDIAGTTEFILQDGTTESRKAASEIKLSNFNNDSGWTTNTGDITGVTAGIGLSGGGTSGGVSLALDVSELSALGTTAASSDYVVIEDVTDNSTKKLLVSNLPAASVDDSVVATLSGSAFRGNVRITNTSGGKLLRLDTGTNSSNDPQLFITGQGEDTLEGFALNYDNSSGDIKYDVYYSQGNHIFRCKVDTDLGEEFDAAKISYQGYLTIPRQPMSYIRGIANGGTSISTTAFKLQFDGSEEEYDPYNLFDGSTNYRFTAPVDGRYMIHTMYGLQSAASTTVQVRWISTHLYKNGVSVHDYFGGLQQANIPNTSGAKYLQTSGMKILDLSANDYIELYADASSTTSNLTTRSDVTSMAIYLLG